MPLKLICGGQMATEIKCCTTSQSNLRMIEPWILHPLQKRSASGNHNKKPFNAKLDHFIKESSPTNRRHPLSLFRTVEVIQDPLDQGRTFKFRVNGQDMFMKGSNWIPAHVLPGKWTETPC